MSGLALLCQFVFRLSLGMAAGMGATSPRLVTSGYFRNHLYVLMGLNALAALAAATHPADFALWPPLTAAVVAYLGSVFWLYEKPRLGIAALWVVALAALAGAWRLVGAARGGETIALDLSSAGGWLAYLDPLASGLLLGLTIAAMFLGHWYLNTPTMELAPLRRLLIGIGAAIALRAAVSGAGLACTLVEIGPLDKIQWSFVALRWLSGIFGMAGLLAMTWHTLKIPNTQAATGMLYVGVIATFLGELTSLLLSQGRPFPL